MGELADKLASKNPAFQRAYLGSFLNNQVTLGKLEQCYQNLTDFDFLSAKIQHPEFGVQTLISDYDLVCAPLQHLLERGQDGEHVRFASERTARTSSRCAIIPQPLLPQGEGEQDFKVPLPMGEGFRVRADKVDMLPQDVSLNPEKVKTLKRLQGALRLSAHVLGLM